MKPILFTLMFMLFTSVIVIGSPGPDRQIQDFDVMKVAVIGDDSAGLTAVAHQIQAFGFNVVFMQSNDSFTETYDITSDIDFDDLLFMDERIPIESLEEDEVKRRFDTYRMPNYNYKPSIKPPRIALHR